MVYVMEVSSVKCDTWLLRKSVWCLKSTLNLQTASLRVWKLRSRSDMGGNFASERCGFSSKIKNRRRWRGGGGDPRAPLYSPPTPRVAMARNAKCFICVSDRRFFYTRLCRKDIKNGRFLNWVLIASLGMFFSTSVFNFDVVHSNKANVVLAI